MPVLTTIVLVGVLVLTEKRGILTTELIRGAKTKVLPVIVFARFVNGLLRFE